VRLIGLAGLKTSGKDTTCQIIKDLTEDKTVERAAFADSLKIFAARVIGIREGEEIASMERFKNTGKIQVFDTPPDNGLNSIWITTGRQYLQNIGGAARDVFGDQFWIDQVLPYPTYVTLGFPVQYNEEANNAALRALYPTADIVVITDVRYPNEASRITELGGEIWQINRPGLESDGHASETPLDYEWVDKVIDNDGSEAELIEKVRAVL
jgi:hypothetical protein